MDDTIPGPDQDLPNDDAGVGTRRMGMGRPMRCVSCDYPLWNLTTRHCPECGTPFQPSDFEFVVNSVRFCCPGCDQAYYGTGEFGQLSPIEFDCVGCRQHVHMDEMVLRPAEGVQERQTTTERMPWLERRSGTRLKSWLETIGLALIQPHRLMRAVPIGSSMGQAWWFTLVTLGAFMIVGFYSLFIVISGVALSVGGGGAGGMGVLLGGGFGGLCLLIAEFAILGVWGLVTHGMLKVTGGATYGLGRTFQAMCYSSGAAALLAVPCIGTYPFGFVGAMWWMVSAILMVAEGQRVHGGRAALATLAVPLLTVVLVVGGYASFVVVALTSPATLGMTSINGTSGTETQVLTQAVIDYAVEQGGSGPAHAAVLVSESDLAVGNFVALESSTAVESVQVADTTLDELEFLPPNRQRLAIQAAVDALPADVVAHRLGDFVFTYHGIDLAAPPDGGLWIVILWPETDLVDAESRVTVVGLADGGVTMLSEGVEDPLEEQNALRTTHGLPPLPHPSDV